MVAMDSMRGIAWSVYWKWALASALAVVVWNLIVGFLLGFLGLFIGFSVIDNQWLQPALQLVVWFTVSFFVLNYFLADVVGKSVGGKRLELLDEATAKGEVSHAH